MESTADKEVSSYEQGSSSSVECEECQITKNKNDDIEFDSKALPPEIWANVLACELMLCYCIDDPLLYVYIQFINAIYTIS